MWRKVSKKEISFITAISSPSGHMLFTDRAFRAGRVSPELPKLLLFSATMLPKVFNPDRVMPNAQ